VEGSDILDFGSRVHGFILVAVASHSNFEPLFQTGFHRSSVVVFLGAFLHLPEMLILDGVLFPSTEKSAFVVLGVEKSRKVFNFIPFFLNLGRYFGTFLLRIQ
jgi:hypothetical protein